MAYLQRADKVAKKLPEGSDVIHQALIKGSIGFSHLLKRQTDTHMEMLRESLREAERAANHIYTTISHYLQLLSAHGYKLDMARTYLALGQFKQDHGQPAEARKAFETAASGFREMGFTFELNLTLDLLK